jgi:hypothetical protein
MFRHFVKDAATTECVYSGIRFFHGHAVEDYADGSFREALWATFGGHEKKIEGGTDKNASGYSIREFRRKGNVITEFFPVSERLKLNPCHTESF